jgi:hypothetical protein
MKRCALHVHDPDATRKATLGRHGGIGHPSARLVRSVELPTVAVPELVHVRMPPLPDATSDIKDGADGDNENDDK